MNLEMIKALRQLSGRGARASSDSEDDSEGSRRGKTATGFEGIHRLRRQVFKHPNKVVRRYVIDVKERLGVTSDQQTFHMRDWSRRLVSRFARFRSQWKVHNMLSKVLQRQLQGEHQIAACRSRNR